MDLVVKVYSILLQIIGILAYEDTLQLVNMVYRHGDRSPTKTFPTNPVPVSAWPQGLGELTQRGMRQQHALGQYMRQRYSGFISSSYSVFQIHVRSTDKDRTLESAYSHLSGLYPPSGRQLWDPSIAWQPIPVHTVPVAQDNLLSLDAVCKRAEEIYWEQVNSARTKAFIKKMQPWLDYLTDHCGKKVLFTNAWEIADTLMCQDFHNMTRPPWYNSTIKQQLDELKDYEFSQGFITTEGIRLRGGSLMKQMISNMLNKTDGLIPQAKIFMYSAHDDTVAAFLSTLQAYSGVPPPYAAVALVELHRDSKGNHFVQLLYKNSSAEPAILPIKGCDAKCPLDKFISLTEPYVPVNWREECGFKPDGLSSSESWRLMVFSALVGAGITIVIISLIAAIFLGVRKRRSVNQYQSVRTDLDF